MKHKRDLDRAVAVLLGLSEKEVSLITGAFIGEARRVLVEEGEVSVSGLGRLKMSRENFNGVVKGLVGGGGFRRGTRKKTVPRMSLVVAGRYRVYFSKASALSKIIRARHAMEKKT